MTQRTDPSTEAQQFNALDAETRLAIIEPVVNIGVRLPVFVAAFGATQGTATAIPDAAVEVIVTVTASTEGVKLPTAVTGKSITIFADPAIGVKVYPFLNDKIEATATNVAVALVKAKATRYYAKNAFQWVALTGA